LTRSPFGPVTRTGITVAPEQLEDNVMTATVLWVIAAILVIVGIIELFAGNIILGIVLIIVGCLVGPGGYSIFNRRSAP